MKIIGHMTSDAEILPQLQGAISKFRVLPMDETIAEEWKKGLRPIIHAEMLLLDWLERTEGQTRAERFFKRYRYMGTSNLPVGSAPCTLNSMGLRSPSSRITTISTLPGAHLMYPSPRDQRRRKSGRGLCTPSRKSLYRYNSNGHGVHWPAARLDIRLSLLEAFGGRHMRVRQGGEGTISRPR